MGFFRKTLILISSAVIIFVSTFLFVDKLGQHSTGMQILKQIPQEIDGRRERVFVQKDFFSLQKRRIIGDMKPFNWSNQIRTLLVNNGHRCVFLDNTGKVVSEKEFDSSVYTFVLNRSGSPIFIRRYGVSGYLLLNEDGRMLGECKINNNGEDFANIKSGDIDGDGIDEVAIVTKHLISEGNNSNPAGNIVYWQYILYIYNLKSDLLWSREIAGPGIEMADINSDGKDEIVSLFSSDSIAIYGRDGSLINRIRLRNNIYEIAAFKGENNSDELFLAYRHNQAVELLNRRGIQAHVFKLPDVMQTNSTINLNYFIRGALLKNPYADGYYYALIVFQYRNYYFLIYDEAERLILRSKIQGTGPSVCTFNGSFLISSESKIWKCSPSHSSRD